MTWLARLMAGGMVLIPLAPVAAQCMPEWLAYGSGFNNSARAIVMWDPDGAGPQPPELVAGGDFSTAGGVPASRIARWNGSTWAPLGTGVLGSVLALTVLPGGDLAAGGFFGFAGGVAVDHIASWDGTSWAPLGAGFNNSVYALAVLPSGDLAAGGNFTAAGGLTANYVARWDGSTWAPLGAGMNSWVYALAVLPNGELAAGGNFVTAGGVSAYRNYILDIPSKGGILRAWIPTSSPRCSTCAD